MSGDGNLILRVFIDLTAEIADSIQNISPASVGVVPATRVIDMRPMVAARGQEYNPLQWGESVYPHLTAIACRATGEF